MKKLITLLLVLTGMASTAMAGNDVYLRSNINATSDNNYYTWDNDIEDYKFTNYGWQSGEQVDLYTFEVTSATIGNKDLQFRVHQKEDGQPEMGPYNSDTSSPHPYTFTFDTDGKNADVGKYDTYTNNSSFAGNHNYFIIPHLTLKASKYKITVKIAYASWGRTVSFLVEIVNMPVTLSADKGTFSCDRALDFTDTGISAYMITGASDGLLTTSDAMTLVPANTGLYLEGSAGTVNVPVVTTSAASEVSTTGNMLKAGAGAAVAAIDGAYTNFILTNRTTTNLSAPLRFYKANGNTVPTNKAYLQILTDNVDARESFWFDEDVTAIEAVKQEVKANGEYYNLAGQRVAQPTKGLYIVNGKKVIMK